MFKLSVSNIYTGSSPEKVEQTSFPVKETHLVGTNVELTSFEKMFFKRAYFLGEVRLDPVLISLIHLDESLKVHNLPDGRVILFDQATIRRRAMSMGREVRNRYNTLKGKKGFKPLQFMLENDLPLDKVCGTFPLVFDDYRRVSHALRMAWAFFLTMKMKKFDKFSFNQRMKDKTFKPQLKNHFTVIFIHIYSQLKILGIKDEKSIIKCLKNSLCFHVSLSLNQDELPEGDHFNMVPFQLRLQIDQLEEKEKVNFFFSLLQSKSLCKEVPEDFILDTLIKHRDQMILETSPLENSTLEYLRERGKSFGKLVRKFYKPNHGFYPTNKASFHFPRGIGGMKGDLIYQDRLKNETIPNSTLDRMEPLVIGLFGQPGQGKSSVLPQLLSKLSPLFPGIKRDDLTYSRSCNVEFWDGYNDQPIVILDDIGQSLEGKDIKEFQTLVSCNPYVLPMADLEEKGKHFSSPIIIVTSNLQYGAKLEILYKDSYGILDDASFWRRIHIPFYVEDSKIFQLKEKPLWTKTERLLCRSGTSVQSSSCRQFDFSKTYYQRKEIFTHPLDGNRYAQGLWREMDTDFFGTLPSIFREREKFHENIRKTWTQVIDSTVETPQSLISEDFYAQEIEPYLPESLGFDGYQQIKSNTYALEFDAFPPEEPLPVRVEPIVEPLKVRCITAGKGETFCLKPLQHAMWRALGLEEQFCLTHGTNKLESNIKRIYENSDPDDVWISGDYTAATDSFKIEATKALMEGILESIDHEPTKRWAMKEISPHLVVYPPDSGIEPVIQKGGQLMGSLLSFPLLCLLNDCTAASSGLSPKKYLINGDDILMRAPRTVYPIWKKKVEEFGLSLSLGKNYIHPIFGTVNSQLIMEGTVLDSGKQKVLDRRCQVLGECLRDLEIMMKETPTSEVHHLFKTLNRSKLGRTVRSISVPVSHGGLAFNWGDRSNLRDLDKRTEILVYLHDLFKKIEPDKNCISIPYLSKTCFTQQSLNEMDRVFNDPVPNEEYHEDFIGVPQLERARKRVFSNPHLRDLFFSQLIEDLPSLSFLETIQVPFSDVKVRKEIQNEIFRVFFINFLDGNKEYGFDSFRNLFLEAVRGVPSATEIATKFLVPVIDLQVKPDYLKKIVNGYTVKSFDRTLFEKSLGKTLQPKNFNLPSLPDSPDFSKEVTESFDLLMNEIFENQDLEDLNSLDYSHSVCNLLDEEISEELSLTNGF